MWAPLLFAIPLGSRGEEPLNAVGPVPVEEPTDLVITDEHPHEHTSNHGDHDTANSVHGKAVDDHAIERDNEYTHTTDHADVAQASAWTRLLSYVGRFHVLAVHLPIALLSLAAFAELAGWVRRREDWLRFARAVFLFGAFGAFAAAGLGWLAARGATYPDDLAAYLQWHRWWGTTVSIVALLGLLSAWGKQNGLVWCQALYRFSVLTLGMIVPVTAHLGGTLIYGPGYLF